MYPRMGGIVLGILMIWLIPGVVASAVAFCLTGLSLGPIYPSTVALVPDIVPTRMVSSAIGFLVGLSILGGALFPWISRALPHYTGIWSLLPSSVGLPVIILPLH